MTLQPKPHAAVRTLTRVALATCATWLTFYALVVWPFVALITPPPITKVVLYSFLSGAASIQPEPAERAMYLVALVYLPIVGYAIDRFFRLRTQQFTDEQWRRAGIAAAIASYSLVWIAGNDLKRVGFTAAGLVIGAAVIVALAQAFAAQRLPSHARVWPWYGVAGALAMLGAWMFGGGAGAQYIDSLASVRAWWIGAPLMLLLLLAWWRNVWVVITLVGSATLGMLAVATAPHEGSVALWRTQFESVFSPVVTAAAGNTILVDFSSAYGAYPHIVGALLDFFTGKVEWRAFAGLMVGLVIFEKVVWLYVLLRTTRHRATAWLAWVVIICATDSFTQFSDALDQQHQLTPYYQLHPIRTLATAFAALLGTWYSLRPSRSRLLPTAVVTSLFIAWWNTEFGLIAWGAALASAIVAQSRSMRPLRGVALVIATYLGSLAVSVGLYALFALARTGESPDWFGSWAGVGKFYGAGLGLAPMELFHPWLLVACAYAIGAVLTMRAMIEKMSFFTERLAACIPLVTVIGLGEFSSFQGRSTDQHLFAVVAPAIVLAAWGLDWLQHEWPSAPLVSAAMVCLVLVASNGMAALPTLQALPDDKDAEVLWADWDKDVAFYKAQTRPGERRLVASPGAALFHSAGGTREIGTRGMFEIVLRQDAVELETQMQLPNAMPVFLDERSLMTPDVPPVIDSLRRTIYACFEMIERSPSGKLSVWQRKGSGTICHSTW